MLDDIIDLFIDDELYIIDEGDLAAHIMEIVAEIDNFN